MKLAQQQQAECLIHFGAGKDQIADGGMPRAVVADGHSSGVASI